MAADCTLLDEQNSEMDDSIAEEEDVGLDSLPRAKTIMVPRIQNMDNYIIKHYKPYMMQELNKQLAEGHIQGIVKKTVKSDQILPGECCFRRFNYWRLTATDFWITVDLRIELRIETPAGDDTDFFWFSVKFWFSFSDDEEEC